MSDERWPRPWICVTVPKGISNARDQETIIADANGKRLVTLPATDHELGRLIVRAVNEAAGQIQPEDHPAVR